MVRSFPNRFRRFAPREGKNGPKTSLPLPLEPSFSETLYTRTKVLTESGGRVADPGRFLHPSGAKVSISPILNERTDRK